MIATCPGCNKRLKIEGARAGISVDCPACGQSFTISNRVGPLPSPVSPDDAAERGRSPQEALADAIAEGAATQPTEKPAQNRQESKKPQGEPRTMPPPLPPSARSGPPGQTGSPQAPSVRPSASPRSAPLDILRAAFNRATSSLRPALSAQKLGFFLAGSLSVAIIGGLLMGIASQISQGVSAAVTVIVGIATVGLLFGVLPGGVAYLTHMENQGRAAGVGAALRFCGRRFSSLFGAVMLVLLVAFVVNGLIVWMNSNDSVGSFIGALLFLPQFVVNLCLVMTAILGVLIPCAVAIEGIGSFAAVSRVLNCMRHKTGQLLAHGLLTGIFSSIVTHLIWTLVLITLVPTLITNGPIGLLDLGALTEFMSAGSTSDFDALFASGGQTLSASKSQSGDDLRVFFVIVVVLIASAYPVVYWIVSFTKFYETVQQRASTLKPPNPKRSRDCTALDRLTVDGK